MTLKEKSLAVVGYLLSCTLVSTIWFGIAGSFNVFLESPSLAPFFQVGFFWMLFYAGVAGGVLKLWLQIPFPYDRERFDIWLFACVAPVVAVFGAVSFVMGVQGILGLLGLCLIGLMFLIPCMLPFLALMFCFGVLVGVFDVGD